MHINYQHQLHHQDVEGLIHKQVAGQLQGNDNNFDEDDDDDDSDDSDHDDDEIAEILANPWSAGNLAPRRDQCHISQNSLSYLVALSAPQNTPGGEITFNKLLHQAFIVSPHKLSPLFSIKLQNYTEKANLLPLFDPGLSEIDEAGYLGVASSKNGFSVRTELYFRGFVL